MSDANLPARGRPNRPPLRTAQSPRGDVLDTVRTALAQLAEPERYLLLGTLFGALAEEVGAGESPPAGQSGDQVALLSSRMQAMAEEKAGLADALAVAKADCAHSAAQFQVEQVRGQEQQKILEDQRTRLDALAKERTRLEAEVVQKNSALHQAEVERERLLLQLQRNESKSASSGQSDRQEAQRRELNAEIARLREDLDELRKDKDAEIDRLRLELDQAAGGAGKEAEALLARLWQRLAAVKPPWAAAHETGNVTSAERLVDGFIELVRFADDLDKSIRVFLDKYTKFQPSVKVSWEGYVKKDDVQETARQTIAVKDARPVGLLKMKLRVLYSWCQAAMIGSDSALESIASELEAQLRGPKGLEADPNRKIKDYLREDGHYQFLELMRELRSRKIAETFGRGG